MKICIYGAGAVGGVVGARLSEAGAEVSLIARGDNLEAIRTNGLKILDRKQGTEEIHQLKATDNPADLGKQDFIFIAVKSHHIYPVAKNIAPLLGEDTSVVTVINGIPWWYFQNYEGRLAGYNLKCLDPEEIMGKLIDPGRIIGGPIYIMADAIKPGVIEFKGGRRITLGELDGKMTERLDKLMNLLEQSDLKPRITDNIRNFIWSKLCWNIMFNPISVITGWSVDKIIADSNVTDRMTGIMNETLQVAAELGLDLDTAPEKVLENEKKSPPFKTSMLQDFEKGKQLEVEGIIGAVVEIADQLRVDVPNIKQLCFDIRLIQQKTA